MTLPKAKSVFRFSTQVNLTQMTTRKARNLAELLANLKEVPSSVIYHHTHRFLKQHQFLSPEPPNDFAYWVNTAIQDERLAEKLAAIDTVRFSNIRELRDKIVQTIEAHIAKYKSNREALPGEEFYFMQSPSLILPTHYEATDLKEFLECLKKVSIHSLYHHIFEARLRLPQGVNDFSNWLLTSLGEQKLAKAIDRLDPYTQTLEGLRMRLVQMIQKRLKEIEAAELEPARP